MMDREARHGVFPGHKITEETGRRYKHARCSCGWHASIEIIEEEWKHTHGLRLLERNHLRAAREGKA